MNSERDIHLDFLQILKYKDQNLIDLYIELRTFVLSHYPEPVELIYHTHALTSVYSISEKLGDAFCMIPIYTNHLNLGFNKGTLLEDPSKLLHGTGKLIRHIPITSVDDFNNESVIVLLHEAITLAKSESKSELNTIGKTISKIKN